MYDSYKDLAHDVSLDNQELRERIKQLKSELAEEKRLRLIAQIDRRYMADKLESSGIKSCIPYRVDNDEIECGDISCAASLTEDYAFCPGCGKWIDWAKCVDVRTTRPMSAVMCS